MKDFATGGHAGEGVPIFTSTAYSNVRVPGVAPNVTDDMAIVVCGLAKLYVGELVDTAKDVMMERLTSAADEDADNNLPLVSAPEEGGGMGTGQSAFDMISSLGAQVTNDVLQLTKADIEEAARRNVDCGVSKSANDALDESKAKSELAEKEIEPVAEIIRPDARKICDESFKECRTAELCQIATYNQAGATKWKIDGYQKYVDELRRRAENCGVLD